MNNDGTKISPERIPVIVRRYGSEAGVEPELGARINFTG
jgi:hypothetical protein